MAAGVEAGKLIKEALPDGGKIMVFVGSMDAQNAQDRFGGIKKELAKYPGIKIVETQGTEDDLAKGVSVTETTLRAHPQLKGIFGVS